MVVDGEVSLVLPDLLTMDIDSGRRVVMRIGVHLLDSRWVGLHDLPALSVVELHPVVLAILNFASALKCLRKELTEVVVVGGVLKTKVADIAEILVELLCFELVECFKHVN